MSLAGVPQGMSAFHVAIGGEVTYPGGWSGSLATRYPTFWVVGGTEGDAVKNAQTVTGLSDGCKLPDGGTVTRLVITAAQAI